MSRTSQTPTHAWKIRDKVRVLSDPQTYPHGPDDVQVTETHMAWVFIADALAFKLKKPVTYDFLDFSALEKRKTAVHDEVRLNRRLAPDVYHDPRPLIEARDERLALDGTGPIVDWLVVMHRLPEESDLETMIVEDSLRPDHLAGVADRLSAFYQGLPTEEIAPRNYADGFEKEHRITASVLTDPELALDGGFDDVTAPRRHQCAKVGLR